MPLDDRLRDAFERSADSIEPAVEVNLEQAIRRGTRPRQSYTGALVAVALAVVVLVVGVRYLFPAEEIGGPDASPTPTAPVPSGLSEIAGSYLVTLDAEDPEVADLGLTGEWSLTLRPTGGMELTPPPSFVGSRAVGHTYTLDGPNLRTDLYYNDYCDAIGEYGWSLGPEGLTLRVIRDECAIRRALLSTKPWGSTP